MTIEFSPTLKQSLLFDYFEDDITTEILYGGSAGCGKSFGVCSLMIIKCLELVTKLFC